MVMLDLISARLEIRPCTLGRFARRSMLTQEHAQTKSHRLDQENNGLHLKEEEGMPAGAADLDPLGLHMLAHLGKRGDVLKHLGWAEH